jgi:threonine dehydrogenase-like Zn-dependent dehydrogenase
LKAVVYTGDSSAEYTDVDDPIAQDGQTIVALSYCGICGSDMHAWHGLDERRVPPLVLGHEAVGRAKDGSYAGQLVAVNPLMRCGTCPSCQIGDEHLCATRELIGMRVPGAFAEEVAVDSANLVALPEDVVLSDVALAEPLACALHAVHLGQASSSVPLSESRLVVLGGGAIGLLCALTAQYYGCSDVLIAETNPVRRKVLEQVTQAITYNPLEVLPEAAQDCDSIIDAVGSAATRCVASALVRPGGGIVHIGLQDNLDGLDARRITLQEITFQGSYCYRDSDFALAVDLLVNKTITGAGWTEVRAIEDGPQAFIDIDEGRAGPKIILNTDP